MPHIRIRGRWRGLAKFPTHFLFGCACRRRGSSQSQQWVVCRPSLLSHGLMASLGWRITLLRSKATLHPTGIFLILSCSSPVSFLRQITFHPGSATSTSPPRSTRRRSSCTRRRSGWIARTMSTTPIEGESLVGLIQLSTVKRNTSCTAIYMNLPAVPMARLSDQ